MGSENGEARGAVIVDRTAPDKAGAVPAEFDADVLEILGQAGAECVEGRVM
jgi:hypothetical protein